MKGSSTRARYARHALLALLAAACTSPPVVVEREGEPVRRGLEIAGWEYRVGPGDLLRVNVFGVPELSSPVLRENVQASPVEGNGEVMLPLIGAVQVDGLTVGEVAARIEERLERYLKEPHVDVAVVEHGAHRYLVLGEVREPGVYVLSRPTTALEAIATAGGMIGFANREQVAWVRGGVEQANLVLLDLSQLDPLATALVSSGDVIFVGRRSWADANEAARDLIPVMQTVSIPLSIAIQAATLGRL